MNDFERIPKKRLIAITYFRVGIALDGTEHEPYMKFKAGHVTRASGRSKGVPLACGYIPPEPWSRWKEARTTDLDGNLELPRCVLICYSYVSSFAKIGQYIVPGIHFIDIPLVHRSSHPGKSEKSRPKYMRGRGPTHVEAR